MIFQRISTSAFSTYVVLLISTKVFIVDSSTFFSPTIPTSKKNQARAADVSSKVAVQATYTPAATDYGNEGIDPQQFCSLNNEDKQDSSMDMMTCNDIQYEEDQVVKDKEIGDLNIHSIEMNVAKESIPTKMDSQESKFSDGTEGKVKSTIKKLISLYLHFLCKYALVTKCITSGFIGIIGDLLAQSFEQYIGNRQINAIKKSAFVLDRIRLFGILFESTFVSGPLMHYAYDYMEHIVPVHDDENDGVKDDQVHQNEPVSSLKKWRAASFHVSADLFILGPIFVFTMMLFTSIIEGNIKTFGKELRLDFIPAVYAATVASFAFVPVQLFAFKHLPIKFRLLYMNFQDVVWNAVVSVMAHKSRK